MKERAPGQCTARRRSAALPPPAREATGHVIATLLNSLPGWLQASPLGQPQRLALMENMLLGAIERTLQTGALDAAA